MTRDEKQTRATNITYSMVAATGYLLDAFGEIEHMGLKSPIFTMALKQTANRFRDQLARAEAVVTGHMDADRSHIADQLGESYILMDRLLKVHLEAGRKLSPETQLTLSDEISGLLTKYGITLPS